MSEISFSLKAYSKIILHAAKYPHCAINGVLLSTKSSEKGKAIEFVDAVPLFHLGINLIPMAEIALTQVEDIASKSDLVISGYYVAHENFKDSSFEKAYHRIADKIAEYAANACLVVVDNQNLHLSQMENAAIKVAQFTDGKYKAIDMQRLILKDSNTLQICSTFVNKRVYDEFHDFDNHLDDVSVDFMNHNLNKFYDFLINENVDD